MTIKVSKQYILFIALAIVILAGLWMTSNYFNNPLIKKDVKETFQETAAESSTGQSIPPLDQAIPYKKIILQNLTISEPNVTIKPGTMVEFINMDDSGMLYDIAADDVVFKSEPLEYGQSLKVTIDKLGEHRYHSNFHPSMFGVIKVVA